MKKKRYNNNKIYKLIIKKLKSKKNDNFCIKQYNISKLQRNRFDLYNCTKI